MTKWEIGQDLIAISDHIGEKIYDMKDKDYPELIKGLRIIQAQVGELFNKYNDHDFGIFDNSSLEEIIKKDIQMKELKDLKLKVGDKVKAFGVGGVVSHITSGTTYPIKVRIRDFYVCFTMDGRYHDWHKEPSLELIERKKTKKKVEFYQRILSNGDLTTALFTDCGKRYVPSKKCLYFDTNCSMANLIKYGEPIVLEIEE